MPLFDGLSNGRFFVGGGGVSPGTFYSLLTLGCTQLSKSSCRFGQDFVASMSCFRCFKGCLYGGEPALPEGLALFGEFLLLWSSLL